MKKLTVFIFIFIFVSCVDKFKRIDSPHSHKKGKINNIRKK